MQFTVKSELEYMDTLNALFKADIFDTCILKHILNVEDGVIYTVPDKYPCIVSIEIEDNLADNRNYYFSSCKFIYKHDLLSGFEYIEKLDELHYLDLRLEGLNNLLCTSGIVDRPIEELEAVQKDIELIEKQLF